MAKCFCIDCGREIGHVGRCLPCNKKVKRRLDIQRGRIKMKDKATCEHDNIEATEDKLIHTSNSNYSFCYITCKCLDCDETVYEKFEYIGKTTKVEE